MQAGDSARRPDPEELLARLQREELRAGRGRLKLFLGFAAGVGKTFEMLQEANRRKIERNQDIVIGYVETHGRPDTAAQIGSLEIVPRKQMAYRGTVFEEMDIDAILVRQPQWVAVDELAHTNVPGSRFKHRYEDVMLLLESGINVLSTLNVQHLESLNNTICQITGVKVRETVPDWVLAEADEIVNIDITPRALIHRLERGDVYPLEKVPQALSNFFTEVNLSALREIALREVASEVDLTVQNYRQEQDAPAPWRVQERVMVCISPGMPSQVLLRRGWRIARRLQADIVAVYVQNEHVTAGQQKILDEALALAQRLNMRVEKLQGKQVADVLANYAIDHQATSILIGHSRRGRWHELLYGSVVNRLLAQVREIDVLVVASAEE